MNEQPEPMAIYLNEFQRVLLIDLLASINGGLVPELKAVLFDLEATV